jgi:hypothetical protein
MDGAPSLEAKPPESSLPPHPIYTDQRTVGHGDFTKNEQKAVWVHDSLHFFTHYIWLYYNAISTAKKYYISWVGL